MNKKISKFVSCVLAVTLFMSLLTVTAFAAESNYDLNGDGKVSVSDVTALQLRISGNRSIGQMYTKSVRILTVTAKLILMM